MRILIHGINFAPELTGIGKYTGEMSAWLAGRGHAVRVVTAPPYYPEWRVGRGYRAWAFRRETVGGARVVRCPLFVPRRPSPMSRLVHLASFAVSSFPVLLRYVFWRPDVVISVVPTLFSAPGAWLVGRLARARTILHVQDFEIDAMVGLGLARRGWLVRIARRVERFVLRRFDIVSSISGRMLERIAEKTGGGTNLVEFPNWVDTRFVRPGGASPYRAQWQIPESARVVLYSGNLGEKQGLEIVLDAARAFADDPAILFVIVGSGAARNRLVEAAAAGKLDNLRFFPLQPYERLPDLLALGDIHLVLQRRGAADLVMPSKLAAILAAGGRALITADQNTELGRLCAENPGLAYLCEPENPSRFIELLQTMLNEPDIAARRPNSVARAYAERCLEKEKVLGAYFETVLDG